MISYKHKGRVRNGKLFYYNLSFYQKDLERFEEMDIDIILKESFEEPTQNQYNFFHGPVLNIALESNEFGGYNKQELKEILKNKFLLEKRQKIVNGEKINYIIIPKLSDLSKKKLSDFIEKCIIFFAESGIEIKDIDDYEF